MSLQVSLDQVEINLRREFVMELDKLEKVMYPTFPIEHDIEELIRKSYRFWHNNPSVPIGMPKSIKEVELDNIQGFIMDDTLVYTWLVNNLNNPMYDVFQNMDRELERIKENYYAKVVFSNRFSEKIYGMESLIKYYDKCVDTLENLRVTEVHYGLSEPTPIEPDDPSKFNEWIKQLREEEKAKKHELTHHIVLERKADKRQSKWYNDEKAYPSNWKNLVKTDVRPWYNKYKGSMMKSKGNTQVNQMTWIDQLEIVLN